MSAPAIKPERLADALDEARIKQAEASLIEMLGSAGLTGLRFLDVGCGRGLFSLAARRLGATVHAFDKDPQSVARARGLKQAYCAGDTGWTIEEGSVLDKSYLAGLGRFDVVYSWGVLHRTGALWQALDNIVTPVAERGRLYISIYNDQGLVSRYWQVVKREYARSAISRWLILLVHAPYMWGLRWTLRSLRGRSKVVRGLTLLEHLLDVFGTYPFEVARPENIIEFYWSRGFLLEQLKLCGSRHDCNEFVFIRERPYLPDDDEIPLSVKTG